MNKEIIGKVHVERWESLGDLVRYAGDNPNPRSSDKRTDNTWSGSQSLAEAVDLCLTGWHDIRPQVDEIFGQMEEHINMAFGDVFEMCYDISGDSVDIDRFVHGEPEHMLEYVTVPSGRMGRVVRVLVNGAANCHVRPEYIRNRGAIVVALLDVLNKLGVGVEVWLESATLDHYHTNLLHSQLCKVHSSEERLDVDNLMFAMAHPSMLRRIGFSILEKTDWQPARKLAIEGGSYGQAHAVTQAENIQADIVIDRMEDATGDPVTDGVKFIMSTIKGLSLI